MATTVVPASLSGGNHVKTCSIMTVNSGAFVKPQRLSLQLKSPSRTKRNLSIQAQYNDRSNANGSEFVAGFLLGGAVFGTLTYIFAPQIRRAVLNEDEHGFRRPRGSIYYDDSLETRLNEKISQLSSAIDNVTSRLRGGKKLPKVPAVPDADQVGF